MNRMEAVKAYLRVARELQRLHGAASAHISRRDNNWQFELYYSLRNVAGRILRGYENEGEYEGGGPSKPVSPREESLKKEIRDLKARVEAIELALKCKPV